MHRFSRPLARPGVGEKRPRDALTLTEHHFAEVLVVGVHSSTRNRIYADSATSGMKAVLAKDLDANSKRPGYLLFAFQSVVFAQNVVDSRSVCQQIQHVVHSQPSASNHGLPDHDRRVTRDPMRSSCPSSNSPPDAMILATVSARQHLRRRTKPADSSKCREDSLADF